MRLSDAGSTALTALNPPATPSTSSPDWMSTLIQGVSAAFAISNQQKVAKLNLQRAQQGLPPISPQDIPGLTPTVNVGVEGGTLNALMLATIALGAVVILPKLLKARR